MGSEDLDQTVEKLLNGGGLEVTAFHSVPEQRSAAVLRKTVCYIVSAVIFNAKVLVFYKFLLLKICSQSL